MSDLKPFCNSCGLCCAQVGKMVDKAKLLFRAGSKDPMVVAVARFPFKYDETGRCEKLGADHLCTVYETRPTICSIEKGYEKFYQKQISREEFYEQNKQACIKIGALGETSK